MKKINILMQYAWVVLDTPYNKFLFDYPPKNANYLNPPIKSRDLITDPKKLKKANRTKEIVRTFMITKRLSLPNIRINFGNKKTDLIHSSHCLLLTNKPWIMDIEIPWQLFIGHKKTIGEKFLLKNNKCKKIICWTKYTQDKLVKILNNDKKIKNKTTVVYPAVNINKKVNQNTKKIMLLFVARYFESKGGELALKTMDKLTKKFANVEGTIVSDTPQEFIEKYSNNKKLKFHKLMPRERLFKEIYTKSNILLYPGWSDSFGYSFLEAMSFGLPIITINGIARDEIVEDGKNGFIIKAENNSDGDCDWRIKTDKTVNEMVNKTCILIKDKKKRITFGNYSFNLVKEGKFSIKERNKQMEKIYREALN